MSLPPQSREAIEQASRAGLESAAKPRPSLKSPQVWSKATLCGTAMFLVGQAAANVVVGMHGGELTIQQILYTVGGFGFGVTIIAVAQCHSILEGGNE